MKTIQQVMEKSVEIRKDVTDAVVRALNGWGEDVDKLRVLGYLGEAMMALAEEELKILKLRDENEKRHKIQVVVH